MKEHILNNGWQILQDVKDRGEKQEIFKSGWDPITAPHVFSEWEPIDHLTHLQLLLSDHPYFGRELRYFNNSPWWYKNEFKVPAEMTESCATLRFEGVDYYCKVWLNDQFLGKHEGYFAPFEFDVMHLLKRDEINTLVVKVWSPWDTSSYSINVDGADFGMTVHDMMKGTYEHSDGFIQRDVNPVGIWQDVKLLFYPGIHVCEEPLITTELSDDKKSANVKVSVPVSVKEENSEVTLQCSIIDESTGIKETAADCTKTIQAGISNLELDLVVSNPKIWNTWDRGTPHLYTAEISLLSNGECVQTVNRKFGIRKVEIRRTPEETTFILNDKDIFIRGTSYFPDIYISRMNRENYSRDIKAMITAGCNAVRIHVHVAKPEFYDLCDELGIAVIQDSDLNWIHPNTEEFKDRAVKIFGDMIKGLRNHPSIVCWICMNEPDLWKLAMDMGFMKKVDPMPPSMMNETPGPQLVEELKKLDLTRPYIKGSIQQNDMESGDSHNYLGSLLGEFTHYTNIDGMPEKLNTEFGFDAPACAKNLSTIPEIYAGLKALIEKGSLEKIQYYQYRLLKYYIEHYRIMKYKPCSGYFQFLFTDICPQSFYGVYDWWGSPKEGLKALEESNQPMGIFMEYKNSPIAIWVINDLLEAYPDCTAEWVITDDAGTKVTAGSKQVDIGEDCAIRLCDLSFEVKDAVNYNAHLSIKDKNGKLLTTNSYKDAFHHPAHPRGHPARMNHEIGMRIFDA